MLDESTFYLIFCFCCSFYFYSSQDTTILDSSKLENYFSKEREEAKQDLKRVFTEFNSWVLFKCYQKRDAKNENEWKRFRKKFKREKFSVEMKRVKGAEKDTSDNWLNVQFSEFVITSIFTLISALILPLRSPSPQLLTSAFFFILSTVL